MARVTIAFPDPVRFSSELTVRIGDVNFGGHLGHDSVVTLLHEARALFFDSLGFAELDIEGVGIIMADLSISYRSEAHFKDRLRVQISVDDWGDKSCAIYYRVLHADGRPVALACTNLVFYDYAARRAVPVPPVFRTAVEAARDV